MNWLRAITPPKDRQRAARMGLQAIVKKAVETSQERVLDELTLALMRLAEQYAGQLATLEMELLTDLISKRLKAQP